MSNLKQAGDDGGVGCATAPAGFGAGTPHYNMMTFVHPSSNSKASAATENVSDILRVVSFP